MLNGTSKRKEELFIYFWKGKLSLKDNFRDIIEIDVCINYYS